MRTVNARGRLAALVTLLAVAGCVSPEPVTIPGAFTPPSKSVLGPAKAPAHTCSVRLGEIKDMRTDKRAAGSLSGRSVYLADSEAWLRSGLAGLGRDRRLVLATGNDPGDLVVHADLIDAYMSQRTGTEKSTSLVFKVRFERGGSKIGEEVVRGHIDNLNWNATDGEIREAFDLVMQDALAALDKSVIAHCAA